MVKEISIKKVLCIFLIISLIFSNVSPMLLGLISYAQEESEEDIQTEEKILEVEVSEFSKNNMLEEDTEYEEKLHVNLDYENTVNKVKISDIKTELKGEEEADNEEDEDEEEFIDVFYQSTKINKDNLLNVIGENGLLEIEYSELVEEDEEETNSQIVQVPEEDEKSSQIVQTPDEEEKVEEEKIPGVILAENGNVILTAETEADEEGFITIIYKEKTNSINISINAELSTIENFTIINTRLIEKVDDLEKVANLTTAKHITVKGNVEIETQDSKGKKTVEAELYNADEINEMHIAFSQTVAELGIDKNQISTNVENTINLTVTMLTNSKKYDLYKNPYFAFEFPSEVTSVRINKALIINNTSFETEGLEQGLLENGNLGIAFKLNGEQEEYTNSIEENIQMVFELALTTEELIPTLDREIILHYINENANTYDGIELQDEGISKAQLQLVSNNDIIVETKAKIGDNVYTSFKDEVAQTNVEPNTYNRVTVVSTAINNTETDLENAKILISGAEIGEIAGADEVYYTENENATGILEDSDNIWTTEHTAQTKKALVVMQEFKQGQTVQFGYMMYLPEEPETDIEHIAKFEVLDMNNQLLKESKVIINQKAEEKDIVEEDDIIANMIVEDKELKVDEKTRVELKIQNNSDEDLRNISIDFNRPQGLVDCVIKAEIDGNQVDRKIEKDENKIIIKDFNILQGETASITILYDILQVNSANEKITAHLNIEDRQIEVSNNLKMIEPATLEAKLTSNKQGQDLNEGDEIEYKLVVKNVGNSDAMANISLTQPESLYISDMKIVNLNSDETRYFGIGSSNPEWNLVEINKGDTVEVTVQAIAKSLKKDAVATVTASISGNSIYDIETDSITNRVNQHVELMSLEEVAPLNNTNETEANNSIKGIAWVDKNENARREDDEILLKGVQAKLIDSKTSEVVETQVTNNNGEYEFSELPEGKYIVEFNYNNTKFGVAEYKKEEVETDLDSDIVRTTQGDRTTSKTEVISLGNGKDEDVNAGFVMNKKFDLSINQGITKVTLDNDNGTNRYEYGSTNKAEVETESKFLKDSLLLVEYEVSVTNIGDVAGYAKLISTTIPNGMEFNSELNSSWYEGNDGRIYTSVLNNTELQPGQTAIMKLILTKEVTDQNEMKFTSIARIEKIFNDYILEDSIQENNETNAELVVTAKGRRK